MEAHSTGGKKEGEDEDEGRRLRRCQVIEEREEASKTGDKYEVIEEVWLCEVRDFVSLQYYVE